MSWAGGGGSGLNATQTQFLSYWRYDETDRKLKANRAIETTLNSLYLGEQHKMSSGAENIFFTNLGNDTNFYPMWGGLKDQALAVNRDHTGFIPPSGRVYTDMFSVPLGGAADPLNSTGYSGPNYFGVNIAGLGITTVAAEVIPADVRLEYRLSVGGNQVYMQVMPRNAPRSSANEVIQIGDVIEWYFDHPVEIHAGTTIYAEIRCVRESDDVDLGVFQVQQGDTVDPSTGLLRYWATVHNRLFEDKDLELISPYLKYQAMDFGVDSTGGSILLRDLTLGADSLLIPHPINTLQAVANGTTIRIKAKGGQKVIIDSLPVTGASIEGALVNSVLNLAVAELNTLFTNAASFASQGNPVTGLALSGDDLTVTLTDGTSYTADVTTLGVDTDSFVSSGAVNGTDLILTMSDGTTVTIDAASMISGSTLSARNDRWYISYGVNANTEVGATTMDSTVNLQGPYYFGQQLTQGDEFKWNMQTGNQFRLGIWDGAEEATAYNASPSMADATNWGTVFSYANGSGKFTDSTNTDVTTYHAGGYSATLNAPMALQFGDDGHLTLLDQTGGTDTVVAKTIVPLAVTEFNLQFGGFANSQFPNGRINSQDWSIVHDFAGTEAGIINGILDHTVLKSNLSISPGEKMMFHLDDVGQGDYFGTDYTNGATGVSTAEEQLVRSFQYQTNESLLSGTDAESAWDWNVNSSGYFTAGGGSLPSYRNGGAGTVQGMFSLRYLSDNTLTLFSEDQNEKVATAKADADGSPIHLHFAVKGNRAHYSIPVISKQLIGSGSQPDANFAPTVADQTATVVEGTALNFQVVASTNIVNQFAEVDAPAWMSMDQSTGVLSGTAPAYTGGAADTIVVSCKAGNAIGGAVEFTVTVTVAQGYVNTKSIQFDGSTSWLQGDPTNVTALERATNGDGAAWTVAMWVKPTATTATQTLMVYGAGDDYNGGAITIKQQAGTSLVVNYGTVYNVIYSVTGSAFTAGQWAHVMVSFDGGTTGVDPNSLSDYFSRFTIQVDGVTQTPFFGQAGNGFDGALSGANPSDNIFRIGRASNVHNNYSEAIVNQVAIWDTDQSANANIYNGGATQDMTTLAVPPVHYWEPEASVTTVTDRIGSANLTGYNFTGSDLVTDTP